MKKIMKRFFSYYINLLSKNFLILYAHGKKLVQYKQ